ncbi:PBECR4 domain-containing protein [Lactococcus hircilactis]|uniref:PBECR4 domain-containing protein n=1 Tax=Lactococcus hircilactis TaxID=1494462 RepID=UPI003FA33F4A
MDIENNKERALDEQGLYDENHFGDLSETRKAAPLPVAKQPLNDLSPNQTQSHPLLHFTINDEHKSIYKKNYHPITPKELKKLNRYALNLQSSAQYYLSELADTKINYFYADENEVKNLQVTFLKENYLHLTGVFPIKEGQTASKSIDNFVSGVGNFDNIMISNRGAAFDKIQVLPQLPDLIESDSFVFDDLSGVEKFHSLNVEQAIRAADKDVILAFRTEDGEAYPASLLKLKDKLNIELDNLNKEKVILGVIREKYSKFDVLSINNKFVKDNGIQMLRALQDNQQVAQENKHKHTQEVTQHKPKKSFVKITDEMKRQAKNTSILDYVTHYGISVKKNSNDEYELVDHANVKFSIKKNLFKDYNPSSGEGGDVIDFVKYVDGVNFSQAVQKIVAVEGAGTLQLNFKAEAFEMPQIFDQYGKMSQALPYLVNDRKLESKTIQNLAQSGLIKQTKNGEAAFIWADGEKDVGATLQGTKPFEFSQEFKDVGNGEVMWSVRKNGFDEPVTKGISNSDEAAHLEATDAQKLQRQYKKMIVRNSTTGHGFNFRSGNPTNSERGQIAFSESPIDVLSYYELKDASFGTDKMTIYQSLEGLKENIMFKSVERFEKRYGNSPEKLIIAVDNDKAGDAFFEKVMKMEQTKTLQEKGIKIRREIPQSSPQQAPVKDWNDLLKQQKTERRAHNKSRQLPPRKTNMN